jgi:hypothetical protein
MRVSLGREPKCDANKLRKLAVNGGLLKPKGATNSRRCGLTEADGGRWVQFVSTFQLHDFLDTLVSLCAAFVFGTLIGAERQYRQRSAGLRTNVLVSIGAAAFVDLAERLTGADGAVRVVAYVVSGIGFLGAGAIMSRP